MANAQDSTVNRTFKFRLLPSKRQRKTLSEILESQRDLYNGAMEHRIGAWRKAKKTLTLYDQQIGLTELRREPEFSGIPANLQRWTLRRVNDTFTAFFRRVKRGDKAGYPRFKAHRRWRSFGFAAFSGLTLHEGRIRFKGLPSSLRVHLHRPVPDGKLLSCTFTRDVKGWYISIQVRIARQLLPSTGRSVGINVGLKELCVLSTGESIPNPQTARRAEREVRVKRRALARCKWGSKGGQKTLQDMRRRLSRIQCSRHTYLHQISAGIVKAHDLIAMETLNLAAIAKGMLARSVSDAGLGKLKQMIAYKAESAGRTFIEVDPRYTTQACSECGTIVPKKLSERWHSCPHCGLEMDRDENAAINILRKGVLALAQLNVAGCGERVAGNINPSARAA
jgi:putative transposase